jgi:lycopene cyclase domain-containing protein
MSLYLKIEILSISLPLVLSFDRKLGFYKMWKNIFPSIFISGSLFIIADIIFLKHGIWGFNPAYLSGVFLIGLPIEEWLFFIIIPYCCLFTHYVFVLYSKGFALSNRTVRLLSALILIILLLVIAVYHEKTYTLVYSVLMVLLIIIALVNKMPVLNSFFISFLIILLPFFIVNAILTGTSIEEEVVWYNNSEIIGFRLLTVPVEDIGYAFSLILLNLLLTENFREFFAVRGSKSKL